MIVGNKMVTKVTKYGVWGLIFVRNPPLFFELGGTYRQMLCFSTGRLACFGHRNVIDM